MKHLLTLLVFFSLLALTHCTSERASNNTQEPKLLNYDSPIPYQFSDQLDAKNAASVDGSPVSWSQIESQDVALQELQQKLNGKALAYAYAWAQAQDTAGPLQFYGPKPEQGLEALLAEEGFSLPTELEVEFLNQYDPKRVAKMGGSFTWTDFVAANLQNAKLYAKVFTQRMNRLNGIVVRRLILEAAKKQDIPMEEFVKTKVLATPLNHTDEEVRAFAIKKGISESDLTELMLERLRDIAIQEDRDTKIADYVAKNLIKQPIAVAFPAPVRKIATPEIAADVPSWGKREAPPLIFVGHWDSTEGKSTLQQFLTLKNQWANSIAGYFIHSFPERDRTARMEAEAALCVQSMDPAAYWTFVDNMVSDSEDNVEERINQAAQGTGIDFEAFRKCFLSRDYQEQVNNHLSYANKMGITSTPVVILNDVILDSLQSERFAATLKDQGLAEPAKTRKGLWAKIKALFGF
jgi:hypothetical protein